MLASVELFILASAVPWLFLLIVLVAVAHPDASGGNFLIPFLAEH
jgi:hypothetical protein